MTFVKNFFVSSDPVSVGWSFGEKDIRPLIDDVESAMLDDVNGCVLVLLRNGEKFAKELRIFFPSGDEAARFKPPIGFDFFSYLTRYPNKGLAVVCSADSPVDGWRDWHFLYDIKSGRLEKYAPAY